jgi:RimJ/RimL family protein N-acetyltransferase
VTAGAESDGEVLLATARLTLRSWQVSDAVFQREMWLERDPRVPPHRRIDAEDHPTVTDIEDSIRAGGPPSASLLVVERKGEGGALGYCGLIDSGRGPQEPELAYEFLRRFWGHGYATEASWAVLDWARSLGHVRLWAHVWDWNSGSRRVLLKLGFTESEREDAIYGTNLLTTRPL